MEFLFIVGNFWDLETGYSCEWSSKENNSRYRNERSVPILPRATNNHDCYWSMPYLVSRNKRKEKLKVLLKCQVWLQLESKILWHHYFLKNENWCLAQNMIVSIRVCDSQRVENLCVHEGDQLQSISISRAFNLQSMEMDGEFAQTYFC